MSVPGGAVAVRVMPTGRWPSSEAKEAKLYWDPATDDGIGIVSARSVTKGRLVGIGGTTSARPALLGDPGATTAGTDGV